MPWRWALDLVTRVRWRFGRFRARSKANRMTRVDPRPGEDRHLHPHLLRMTLVGPPPDAGIFALRVLADDDPVQVLRVPDPAAVPGRPAADGRDGRSRTARSPGRSAGAVPKGRCDRERKGDPRRRNRWRRRPSGFPDHPPASSARGRGSSRLPQGKVSKVIRKFPVIFSRVLRTSIPAGMTSRPIPSAGMAAMR